MAPQNPTIIVGHLDSTELTKSIDKLVAEVAKKTSGMAEDFTQAIDKMKLAMKDFAITQKVSVDLMKEAWRDMSRSFDAMVAAQSTATGGGNGSGKGKVYAPNTVGALEQEIAKEKEKRREMQLGSVELDRQNILLEKRRKLLKEETSSPYQKVEKSFSKEFGAANSMSAKTLQQAEDKLKRLIDLQNRFKGNGLVDEAKMNRLQKAIDNVTDKITKLRNAKPKSLKEVLGMDASSLDAIQAKMKAIANFRLRVNADAHPRLIQRLNLEYDELHKKQLQLMGQNASLARSNNYLAQSFGYIRNRIVYALTLGAISNFIKQLYEIRGQYELLERSLGVLVGSFEKGTQIFNELNEMAIKSPFTLIELGTAAKQLTAYNFAANEVVDTTRRLADISAALGVPMERLTYNLGQIKAQGILNARDARDFANAGLAIVPMLAKMYTEQKTFGDEMVTTAQVYDMMSKKMVTYGDVLKVLYRVTDEGGKFFDFQAKQADTLRVQMANLTLAYNNMLNEIGSENQGVLVGMVSGLKTLLKHWREISRVLLTVITTLGVYKGVSVVVAALNSKMFVGSVLVGLRNYINGIKNATGAMATFNAVTKGNPIGMLIGLLTAAISYFVLFKNTVEDASEEVEMFGESAAKSINKVKTLQKILQGTEETSSTYKKTLSELSQIAKEYGIQIDAEKASRDEANKSAERTIELIREESAERQRANQLEKARERYEEQTSKAKSDFTSDLQGFKDLGYTDSVSKELVDNADAISDVVSSIIEDNIQLVVGKTKEEADKGLDEIKRKIQQGLTRMGISKEASKLLFENVQGGLLDLIVAYRDAAEAQENYNQKTENYYQKSKKITNATMTFTEKVDANARALRNNADDAVQLYNRIRDIVETFSKTHNIDFKLNLIAEKPPKWMFDKSLPELQRLAIVFASIAASGGKAAGHTVESTYQRAFEYAAAAKQMQEEEDRKARMKETKTKTKKGGGNKKDVLGDALTEEIKLIKDIQNSYKEYKKAGVDTFTAVALVADRYNKSLETQNAILSKFGITGLTGEQLANMDLHKVRDFYQQMLDVASRLKNTKGVEALENAIGGINDEIVKVDYKRITEGLNNKLGQLKDEYELAVALDADPELGSLFTEMFKIDTSGFPRTLQQMVEKTQDEVSKSINKAAKASGGKLGDFNIVKGNLEKWAEQNNIDITSDLYGKLKSTQEQIRKLIRSNFEETSKSWDKLLEKYAEYQYKQTKIAKEANQERLAFVKKFGEPEEIASATTLVAQIETEKDSEKKEILKQQLKNLIASISEDNNLLIQVSLAIDERELREQAKLSFEEFQKTPEWILATGELSEMSYRAINTLIEKIQDYRREAKNLSPKQIKDINKALRDLYKEQRKDNPFASIGNMIDRAKDRMSVYDEEIEKVEKQIDEARFSMKSFLNPDGEVDEDYLSNLIEKWKQLKKAQKEAGEIDPSDWVAAINATVKAVQAGIGVFNDLAKAIEGVDSNEVDKIFSVLDKAGENAAIGAQIGGAYGAIVGAIVGAGTALVSIFATLRNEEITEQVEASERAVKRLENVYKSLEHTATDAYGAIESGAKRALRSNKELQLAQLERQLQLEESRDSKDQDEDKIIDLRGQINELRNDINDVSKDIVNDLLGISSAGDGIEGMVSSMIDAFRNGEDVMKAFGDSFDEMVDNMILKLVVTQFMQKAWDNLLKNMENKEEQMLKQYADTQAQAQAHYDDVRNYSDEELRKIIANERYGFAYGLNYSALDKVSQEEIDAYRKAAEEALTNSTDALNNASLEYTKWSLDYMNTEGRDYLTQYATMLKDSLGQWYTYGENKELELSSLRQGISGITEDTANALEAYMNIVSQRVFYNGSLLEQIRDAVVGMDMDVQTATQAQMLLQLQQSYQVQMSIQGILQGVLTPSGRAFSVELLS